MQKETQKCPFFGEIDTFLEVEKIIHNIKIYHEQFIFVFIYLIQDFGSQLKNPKNFPFLQKLILLGSLLASINPSLAEVTGKTQYTTKYDNVDINEVVHNERLLKNYVNCLLETGSCSPDGLELKSKIVSKPVDYREKLWDFFELCRKHAGCS